MTISARLCCQAAELALRLGQNEEAVALCRHVLAHHHWHLRAHLLLGQACLEQEKWAEAERRFRLVLGADPECAEAYSGLGMVALAQEDIEQALRHLARAFENMPESDEVREVLRQALGRQAGHPVPPPAFTPACVGRFYLRRGLPQPAAQAYAAALHRAPGRKDLLLGCATALWQAGAQPRAVELCQPLLTHTPRPLTALLICAANDFLTGNTDHGRRLWNEARAWDPDDLRASAIFDQTPGLPLPNRPAEVPPHQDEALVRLLETATQLAPSRPPLEGEAAAELTTYAQNLATSTSRPAVPVDPDLRRFQRVLEDVDHRLFGGQVPMAVEPLPPAAHKGRQAAEVILAWEEGLRSRFGPEDAARITQELHGLAQASVRRGITSQVVFLDRPPYPELARPDPSDPAAIKSFLDQLDSRLAEEELDFHYLLLVGGDDLLPFARLPNPGEDSDEAVLSDNLYASRDPTYLIPERAVGRLPDGGPEAADLMLEQLSRCIAHRRGERPAATRSGCLGAFWPWLDLVLSSRQGKTVPQRRFGISAQVWAEASEQVFRVLPGTEPLHLCPPVCQAGINPAWLTQVPFAYFNLHGAPDSPNWYGHRDLTQPGTGQLMPIAFSPQEIPAGQVQDIVVYSEACYGAYVLGKTPQSSVALRFLAEGALGFVGSTVISYGVSAPPLTDADLLGQFFLEHLLRGEALGDALLQAKLDFTRELYRRQGYLDGDDMKTLLQFVLYGDPLNGVGAVPSPVTTHGIGEEVSSLPVLCGRHAKAVALHQLSGDLVERVRRSLTWLQQGEEVTQVDVALRSACPGSGCSRQCHQAKGEADVRPEALIFTARRDIETEDGTRIPQVARVVVDPRGRIVKMSVTR